VASAAAVALDLAPTLGAAAEDDDDVRLDESTTGRAIRGTRGLPKHVVTIVLVEESDGALPPVGLWTEPSPAVGMDRMASQCWRVREMRTAAD